MPSSATQVKGAVRLRRVFLEPLWKLRREFAELVADPPPGYEFVVEQSLAERTATRLARTSAAYRALWVLLRIAPVQLLKPWWERLKRLPADIDLTYSILHVVYRQEPWVLDMRAEQPHLLVGSEGVFERWKGLLRRPLTSPHCRRIIYEVEAGRQALLERLPWPELAQKTVVIRSGVPSRRFAKAPSADGRVKLLFVNSANINAEEHFYTHGGPLVLAAFLHLRRRYPQVELVVRSRLPPPIRARFAGVPGLRIIEDVLSWEGLEREFVSADIFVYPNHVTPSIVFLDAMSYELPIVTTDVWANPELVEDGRTGLLIHHRNAGRFTEGHIVHFDSPAFKRTIREVDPWLVQGVVEQVSLLIEQPELRQRLGRQGRQEVEEGRFSLEKRNRDLKKALDEACAVEER